MDFPVFHLDLLGNRLLIAIIAITHVVMSHTMAVGGIPLIAYFEWRGIKEGDKRWDQVAFRILFVFFILTTTVGAMTGVGIWFSTSLVNPTAIGSLIRVFFWAWFVEWIAFVTEVVLILFYYLTWKKWAKNRKRAHLNLGISLAIASWITMVIIVAILSYMMDIGSWNQTKSFFDAFLNPVYLPQLAFRTGWGMLLAGCSGFFVYSFKIDKSSDFDLSVKRAFRGWNYFWLPVAVLGSVWYWSVIPSSMKENLSVALSTQTYQYWYSSILVILAISVGLIVIFFSLLGHRKYTRFVPRVTYVLPFLISVALIGQFERVREFIRKPYAIANYLYANTVRKADMPLLTNEGILKHANFARVRVITGHNRLEAGAEVFKIACTRCHTVNSLGVNSIRDRLDSMLGDDFRGREASERLHYYILNIHQARPYMPPFPGNDDEAKVLAEYLVSLDKNSQNLSGDQTLGSKVKRTTLKEKL